MNMMVPKVLDGELLGPADDIRVVAALHPMRRARVERRMPAGITLAEIAERIASEQDCLAVPGDFQIHIDGHPIAPAIWHCVRPKPTTTVTLHPTLQGFLAPIIGAIGAAFASFNAFIAGLGFFGKLLMAGLSIGVKLLMNALFAPRPPVQETPKIGYSFTGARNQAAPFEAVPVILGHHRFVPFYGGLPYTESVGEDQYLRVLFVWGYGPLSVSQLKIGETPISSFSDVQIETRNGYVGDAPVTLYPRQVVEEPLSIELKFEDGWHRRSTAENINEISLDVVMPNGIRRTDNKGRKNIWTVVVMARYRLEGTSAWINLPNFFISDSTLDTIRRTVRVAVAPGKYEVEVAKTDDYYDYDPENNNVTETVVWTALRGFRNSAPLNFDKPLCVTAIRIKATSQLNGTLDTLNGEVISLVKAWNGVSWVANQPSRNPADLFRHVLQGPANARPVPDSQVDLVALQGWHAYCVANGWTFDHPRVTTASVFDTLADIAAAGRAMTVFKDGKWSVMWDEQDTPVVQMFTPRNSWGFEATHEFREMPHGWRVRFINAQKGWIEDERIVYDDGYSAANATRFEGLDFPGVTHPSTIWRHGRFHLAQLRLRPETYTLNVDFENLACTRGDRVRIAHDVMLLGLASGRVTFVDGPAQRVVLDERLILDGNKLYQIRFRLADGSFVLRSVVPGSSGETQTINLDGSGDLPAVGDLFTLGEATRDSAVYRVLGIEPQDDITARLTLVDDAPGIYEADTGAVPAFESNVTVPLDPYLLPPTDIRINASVYLEGDAFLAAVRLSWQQPRFGRVRHFDVDYRNNANGIWRRAASVVAPQTSADIRGLESGSYTFAVRAIFDDGSFSRWVYSETFGADTLLRPPPDVTGFKIAVLGDLSTLSWTAVQAVGISHYEIRFVSAESATVEWNSATPLIPEISGSSAQVPTMVGSYLIKAVYQTGVKSLNAAVVRSSIAAISGLNVVEFFEEGPAFAGAVDGVNTEGGVLRLLSNNTLSKWDALNEVVTLYSGDGEPDSLGLAVTGIYNFAGGLDLGEVYTSRLTALVEASGENTANVMATWLTLSEVIRLDNSEPEDWNVELQYRTTSGDPALGEWSGWLPFFVGDVSARAFEFRIVLQGTALEDTSPAYSNITPVVSRLKVSVDMPDRVVAGEDIPVPASGLDVVFDPPFISLQGLATADQDMATGDRKLITGKGPGGFHIQFFNSAGAAVARTIDYVAKGYGAMQ